MEAQSDRCKSYYPLQMYRVTCAPLSVGMFICVP
nr:MAG TPA: hypothetical protein [Caudoviricetes sp.]